jgi:tRNA(Ile)-lysidine synthase
LGRFLRRAFFQEVRQQFNADSIALAHHADDQLETFFIRLLRGTTVTGLACMRPKQDPYIRPLLCIKKQEILDYLERKQISYLTDPTNKSPDFLRNRIRMSLIPVLEQIDTRYFTNIQKVIGTMQETDAFLQQLAQQTLATISPIPQNIDIKKLLALDSFLQKLVITQWLYSANVTFTISSAFIDEILRFFSNKKSNTHQFNQWLITKTRNIASIVKIHAHDQITHKN